VRVAVTGGAGYIGSVVVEVLLREQHDVLVLDNLPKGHRDAGPEAAAFANVDLLDGQTGASQLRTIRCDAVVHMAASSLVGDSVTDPATYYRNNVVAGLSLLDAMRETKVRRLVFSSTAAVYGEPVHQPIIETDPHRPTNPYGETKLAFERTLGWYADAYGLASISLRYFNAAGATLSPCTEYCMAAASSPFAPSYCSSSMVPNRGSGSSTRTVYMSFFTWRDMDLSKKSDCKSRPATAFGWILWGVDGGCAGTFTGTNRTISQRRKGRLFQLAPPRRNDQWHGMHGEECGSTSNGDRT
jgi:nucleoside-diphosphate-sugar epimerase